MTDATDYSSSSAAASAAVDGIFIPHEKKVQIIFNLIKLSADSKATVGGLRRRINQNKPLITNTVKYGSGKAFEPFVLQAAIQLWEESHLNDKPNPAENVEAPRQPVSKPVLKSPAQKVERIIGAASVFPQPCKPSYVLDPVSGGIAGTKRTGAEARRSITETSRRVQLLDQVPAQAHRISVSSLLPSPRKSSSVLGLASGIVNKKRSAASPNSPEKKRRLNLLDKATIETRFLDQVPSTKNTNGASQLSFGQNHVPHSLASEQKMASWKGKIPRASATKIRRAKAQQKISATKENSSLEIMSQNVSRAFDDDISRALSERISKAFDRACQSSSGATSHAQNRTGPTAPALPAQNKGVSEETERQFGLAPPEMPADILNDAKKLKAYLREHDIDVSHCIEKDDLLSLLHEHIMQENEKPLKRATARREQRSVFAPPQVSLPKNAVPSAQNAGPVGPSQTSLPKNAGDSGLKMGAFFGSHASVGLGQPVYHNNASGSGAATGTPVQEARRIQSLKQQSFPSQVAFALAVLGLQPNSEFAAVQKAFRSQMAKFHPDKPGHQPYFPAVMQKVREAKQVCEQRLSSQQAPSAPTNVRCQMLCATVGKRKFRLEWNPPVTSSNAPISKYVVNAFDPGFGRSLAIAHLEPEIREGRFVSIDEITSHVVAEEELSKMPLLFKQSQMHLDVVAANQMGKSAPAKTTISLAPRVQAMR